MKSTSIPDRTTTVFASSGNYNAIAKSSTTDSLASGTATFDVGFPPLTMTNPASGGIPPSGEDMNGILRLMSLKQQWSDAGMGYPFDSTMSGSIGGYPKGARLPASNMAGFWINTLDANVTSPEGDASQSTGWIPVDFAGETEITGLNSSSVTLTCLQAANYRITLSGTLTSNIYIYFPLWVKDWYIVNNCTGNYSVICSTIQGANSLPLNGYNRSYKIHCDGSNVYFDQEKTSTTNGKIYFDNGMLWQWGTTTISGTGERNVAITLPTPYTSGVLQAFANGDITSPYSFGTGSYTANGFNIYVPAYYPTGVSQNTITSTVVVHWNCIGI